MSMWSKFTADDVSREISGLRDRLDSLGSRLAPKLSAAADEAGAMGDQAQRRVSSAVRDQPLVALGLAVVTGFILASIIKR